MADERQVIDQAQILHSIANILLPHQLLLNFLLKFGAGALKPLVFLVLLGHLLFNTLTIGLFSTIINISGELHLHDLCLLQDAV